MLRPSKEFCSKTGHPPREEKADSSWVSVRHNRQNVTRVTTCWNPALPIAPIHFPHDGCLLFWSTTPSVPSECRREGRATEAKNDVLSSGCEPRLTLADRRLWSRSWGSKVLRDACNRAWTSLRRLEPVHSQQITPVRACRAAWLPSSALRYCSCDVSLSLFSSWRNTSKSNKNHLQSALLLQDTSGLVQTFI